jgi:hypothetical protein
MAISKTPPPPLEDRIAVIRAEIDAFIDGKVEEERKRSNGALPPALIRQFLTAKAVGCPCRQYLKIKEDQP